MRRLYIYKQREWKWDAAKKYLYGESDEELKKRGRNILENGSMEEEGSRSAMWTIVYNIDGEIVKGDIGIANTGDDGWKLTSF